MTTNSCFLSAVLCCDSSNTKTIFLIQLSSSDPAVNNDSSVEMPNVYSSLQLQVVVEPEGNEDQTADQQPEAGSERSEMTEMMNTKATTVRLQSDADKQCETMGSQTEADAKYRVRG